jgi:hypothetical protein
MRHMVDQSRKAMLTVWEPRKDASQGYPAARSL